MFAATATARLMAAGSRKLTASLFASATSFGSFSFAISACSAAQPSGRRRSARRARSTSPSSAFSRLAASFSFATNSTHSFEVVGLPGGDEPPHDLRHDLVADERVVGACSASQASSSASRRAAGVSRLVRLARLGRSLTLAGSPGPSRRRATRVAG